VRRTQKALLVAMNTLIAAVILGTQDLQEVSAMPAQQVLSKALLAQDPACHALQESTVKLSLQVVARARRIQVLRRRVERSQSASAMQGIPVPMEESVQHVLLGYTNLLLDLHHACLVVQEPSVQPSHLLHLRHVMTVLLASM